MLPACAVVVVDLYSWPGRDDGLPRAAREALEELRRVAVGRPARRTAYLRRRTDPYMGVAFDPREAGERLAEFGPFSIHIEGCAEDGAPVFVSSDASLEVWFQATPRQLDQVVELLRPEDRDRIEPA
jgi:hypothetical protein